MKLKHLFIAIWVLSLASFAEGVSVRGDKFEGTNSRKRGRRKLFQYESTYPPSIAPTISSHSDTTLTVVMTSPNQNDDRNEMTYSEIKNTFGPSPSPTRYSKERRNDNKSNKSKSTPSPTSFPTASPTFFPTASPTKRNKKNKDNENKIAENTRRPFPTASPTAFSSLSNVHSNIAHTVTESPFAATASPTQAVVSENNTGNEEKIPKSAEQVSVSIVKEPPPPPTDSPSMKISDSASEMQPSDDGDDELSYATVTLKSFDIQLTAEGPWQSEHDPLVQHVLERYLENAMTLRETQIHKVELTISSLSYDEASGASFRFKGVLYMDPIEDDISPDFTKEVWNQQNVALVNHLIVQLHLDEDDTLAAARVVLVNVDLLDESVPHDSKDESEEEARISAAGRKSLTVIGLIIAFLLAMGIGVWCISPFDGYDDDDDGSHFGKPRESFSQAATDEILVDHDEIQSVTSSLTGAAREEDEEDHIYLREFVSESRTNPQHDNRSHEDDDDDDQDSFYSNVQPYFYKATSANIGSTSVSSNEPSIYSVWKDPERKQQYESLRHPTNNSNAGEADERRIRIHTTNRRNEESTITSNSMFLTEESTTTGGSVSLPAAPSRAPPTSISLSESLRLRIASHLLAEELLEE